MSQSFIHTDTETLKSMEENLKQISTEVRIIQRDMDRFQDVLNKFDDTNNNLNKLITNVEKIVAIHEEKLRVQSENYEKQVATNREIYTDISKKFDHMTNLFTTLENTVSSNMHVMTERIAAHEALDDEIHEKVEAHIEETNKKISKMENIKWALIGGFTVISVIAQAIFRIFFN